MTPPPTALPPARLGRRRLLRAAGPAALAAAALAAPLGACVRGVLPGQGPGPSAYRLTPKTTFDPSLRRAEWALSIAEPLAERTLDTNRIVLLEGGTKVDYLADAVWVDRAPAMVESLMILSFTQSRLLPAVATDRDPVRPDVLLRPTLRAFQAQAEGGRPARVFVGLDLVLLRLPRRDPLGNTSLTAETVPAAPTVDALVLAFDEGLGAVLRDTVEWTLRTGQAAKIVTRAGQD